MSDTGEILRELIARKFEKDPAVITPDATLETLGIDSMDTFDLIFDAEDAFGIKMPGERSKIETVQDVINLIDRLRVEQGKA